MKKGKILKQEKAITLIALMITIIILLILAGVTISLILGNNGILRRAVESVEKNEEGKAREKLEIVLSSLMLDKNTVEGYNNEYIDNELIKQEMIVIGDVVIVDDWGFEIDREIPRIITSIGKGLQNDNIKLTASGITREDYVNATIKVDIECSQGKVSEIQINGGNKDVPIPNGGIYTINEVVTENGIYTILVKDDKKNFKMKKVEIKDLTEDMDIWNRADMEEFRDKVNSGRTFEGKTARVMSDINLEGSEDNKWIPIGDYSKNKKLHFKGTFEGNNHRIDNLYINTSSERVGLFGVVAGEVKNLTIGGIITSQANYVGGVCGVANKGSKISNCINKTKINGKVNTGGLVGYTEGEVRVCINEGAISGTERLGGISGASGAARLNLGM